MKSGADGPSGGGPAVATSVTSSGVVVVPARPDIREAESAGLSSARDVDDVSGATVTTVVDGDDG